MVAVRDPGVTKADVLPSQRAGGAYGPSDTS
jgi:hypothetical protein